MKNSHEEEKLTLQKDLESKIAHINSNVKELTQAKQREQDLANMIAAEKKAVVDLQAEI